MAHRHDRRGTGRARGAALALLLAALAMTGCAPAAPAARAVQHERPRPTIVSLNPCLDAILVEIAAPGQVLALSHYSRDPASSSIAPEVAARHRFIGDSAEEVIALRPDLVLASMFLPAPTRRALEAAGLKVATFGSPTSIAQSAAQVREVARLARREGAGAALAARIAARPAPPPGKPLSALLWQPGEITAGEATLIAQLLREAGFASHAAARGLGQADRISLEQLLADPPQVLMIAGDEAGQRHPVLRAGLPATHIARFDPRLLYCGGPTIPRARARLAAIRAAAIRQP